MLIRELLAESSVADDIRSDLMDLITTYRNARETEIPMEGPNGALRYLKRVGHDVSVSAMMDVLSGEEFSSIVSRSDPTKIELKPVIPEPMVADDELEKSQEKVDKTATKVAKSTVKSGDSL